MTPVRLAAILAISAAVVLALWVAFEPDALQTSKTPASVDADGKLPRRPSARQLGQWMKASNDRLAARAADYKIDAPRRRDKNGQALPFREQLIPAGQVRALQEAGRGAAVRLDLFPEVSFTLRITGHRNDSEERAVFAALDGHPPSDRFAMAWAEGRARGLLEIPSRNLAYEIVMLPSGGYAAREWLFSDAVCARASVPGTATDTGIPPAPAADPVSANSGRIAPGEVPILNSRPSAAATIYLDFDGEVVSGTAWAGGATINALPARMSATQVQETWGRVAKHFGVFDVNVTTDRAVFDAAPANRKTHCVITSTTDAAPGAGGVAYVGSFTNPSNLTKICWTFDDQDPAASALITSHEVGHTLGLLHHGRVAADSEPREEYYLGHGTGETGWGPFMGAPYGKNLLQWSKGEYDRANNSAQDDLAVISQPARIPFIADDHGNSSNGATAVVSGVAVEGVVEKNTDEDFYRLLLGTGAQPVSVALPVGTMLDARIDILAEDAITVLESVNPAERLAASTVLNFSAPRTVYIRVVGTGKPPVTGTGYSAYSSLGSYTLTAGAPFPGKVSGLAATPVSDTAIDVSWPAAPAATAYIVRRNGVDIANTGGLLVRDSGLTEQTAYTYTVVASNGTGAAQPSDPATATTFDWWRANPFGLRVTNPPVLTPTEAASFVFAGRMGQGLVGSPVQWTNVGRGLSGYVAFPGTNWSTPITLGAGTNRIVFSAAYDRIIGTNVTAYDSAGASHYATAGWVTGVNGGYGFGAWSNNVSSTNASLQIVDEFAAPSMKVGRFEGFALRGRMGASAVARRSFGRPLAVGESFTINLDSNLIDAGRSVGFSLADGGGTNRLVFSAVGGAQSSYVIRDGNGTNTNTGIAYTTDGLLPVTVTVLTNNGYRLVAGTNLPITGSLSSGGSLGALVVSNSSAGSGEQKSFYLGDMSILSLVTTNQSVVVSSPLVVQSISAPPVTDGIPDAWWSDFGIPAGERVAVADRDGDGSSNAQEYAAGTSPTDFSSRFAISGFVRDGSNLFVSWSAVVGKVYSVETNGSPSAAGWQAALPVITNASGAATLSTNVPASGSEGFLRVRLLP